MVLPEIKLQISAPTEPLVSGRGFYQLEEDALYVQVAPFTSSRRFFSYLESEHIRFDIDRQGRLIFIEVCIPRRQWPVNDNLTVPENTELADIRWLDFRSQIEEPNLVTDQRHTQLLIRYPDVPLSRNFLIAESIVVQVDEQDNLAAIFIGDIVDDIAGQEIATFRKRIRGREQFFEQSVT
ncbi:MAG: hypothetical protein DRP47_02140 [Candidatus Zixiibacteriota bacterium]|nr:MAG: hypothetical protein DRP47_02140 [candidate division Zixibacteria bacterium]